MELTGWQRGSMMDTGEEECPPRVNTPAALFTWHLQHPEVPWNSARGTPSKPANHTSAKANMIPSQ